MGRVEKRLYKRRRSRRIKGLLIILGAAALLCVLLVTQKPSFSSDLISRPTPTPRAPDYDQTVETREVTLAAETWYAIQTGVFSTREAALGKADAYADRGAPGIVIQDGEKWRVFIACYGNEGDASAVRTRLGEVQRVETYLYAWECPELRLRLTGMAGQLDVVEAGFTLLSTSASALRDAATLLDAAQLTTEEAADRIAGMDSQIKLWQETVQARFGSRLPELVQSMQTLWAEWPAAVEALQAASSSATSLSAEMKLQAMALYGRMISWRSAMYAK